MANPNIGQMVARVWDELSWELPSPFDESGARMADYMMHIRHSYRYWLDRIPRNIHGQEIPRITTVRHNLRRLGNIRLDPKRLR